MAVIGLDPKKDLVQYGVRGMKWGVRKKRSRVTGPEPVTIKTAPGQRVKAEGGRGRSPSDDAKRAAALKQKARASTLDSLSNSEIQTLVARMNLEQQYARLDPPKQNPVKGFLKGIAKTEVEAMQKGKKGPGLSALESAMAGEGYVGKRRKK
jgi:hypothetical protein